MPNSGSHTSTEQVKRLLQKAYRSLISKQKRIIVWRSLLIVCAGITTLILLEQLFYLHSTLKTISLLLFFGIAVSITWKGLRGISTEAFKEFYRDFSRKSKLPELKDALDLEKGSTGNRELIDAAILQSLGQIESLRLEQQLEAYIGNTETHKNHSQLMIASTAILFLLSFTVFNFQSASERTLTFWKDYAKPNPFIYTVDPGNTTFEQGSPFRVDVTFDESNVPENVSLRIKTDIEEEFRTRGMEAYGNTFRSVPQPINNDLEYYIEMDGYRSENFYADIQLRPRFTELQATILPPAYTRLDSSIMSYPMSQVRAYQGSTLRLRGVMNKPVSVLQLKTSGKMQDLLVGNDSSFTYELAVQRKDTLRFYMEDENGLVNENPFQIIIEPSEDEFPLAEIIEPENNLKKVNPQELRLLYRASDDFGLTGSRLHFELKRAFTPAPVESSINLKVPDQDALNSYLWDLNSLNLKPRDELTFWISVQDNDGFNGFKTALSQKMVLTVPSLVDYFEDVDEKENEVSGDLNEISEAFEQSRQQYEQFKEQLKDNPENPGYEEKRELEQVQKQQEEVQKRIDELNQKFEELKEELSENSMLSEETRKAYEELEKLMKEIDDPAFREAMKQLQEQLGNMNPEELRKAMENMEFNEELYRERLNRTIELFKQLKLNSDLDKLATSFEEMARRESDSTKTREELQQTKEENEKLKEQAETLSENTSGKNQKEIQELQENLKKNLDEINKSLDQELKESSPENSEENQKNPSDQQQNGEQKQQGENQSQQQKRQEQYRQMAEETRSAMKSMNQQQMNVNIAGLQYVLHSLLNLSLEQEDLTTLVASTENRSQAYVTYARDQRNVESIFRSLSDSLFQLSSEIPQFSNQINRKKEEVEERLQQSLEQMSERNQSQSSVASRQAMGGINDISFMLANLLEQLQNQQNGSGGAGGGMSMEQMMEQLQQNSQQQQQLNQQMQEMINDMQGERLQRDQMERLNQLAKQQNRIRKQLQELQRQGGLEGDRIGSELERMIEEMEDTINDLRGGSTDPIMIKRQQNILQRMLDAENAMQERDEEDKREGQAVEEFELSNPPELTLEELEKEIRNRLNDPNFTKYSEDYQRLIEKYFELLKELQDREL